MSAGMSQHCLANIASILQYECLAPMRFHCYQPLAESDRRLLLVTIRVRVGHNQQGQDKKQQKQLS